VGQTTHLLDNNVIVLGVLGGVREPGEADHGRCAGAVGGVWVSEELQKRGVQATGAGPCMTMTISVLFGIELRPPFSVAVCVWGHTDP
jgi:hypothetical protein